MDRLIAEVGDRPVESINTEILSIYKRRLMDAALSPATMKGLLSCLKQFLRYTREVQRLNVMEPEKIRGPRVPFREVEYLTKEEVMRFLEAFPSVGFSGARDRALAEMLCGTGMRISEALSLDRDQIDWQAQESEALSRSV
jgi:site-specific recombinase XerD